MNLLFAILLAFSPPVLAQQYMPQVETPAFPEIIPWEPPECPQVVEEGPGYLEMLWGVVRDAFRFVTPPSTVVVTDGTIDLNSMTIPYGEPNAIDVSFAEPNVRRIMALEQKVKELEASNDALTTDVLRLVGKELRRKDDANKPWWEANDYWEATYSALCAWLLEYQIPPGAGGGSSSWNALRKACGEQ